MTPQHKQQALQMVQQAQDQGQAITSALNQLFQLLAQLKSLIESIPATGEE